MITTTELADRIQSAVDVAVQYGGIDGAHHKDWVIDQMVRCLTGCTPVERLSVGADGMPYRYMALGESAAYIQLVLDAKDGEDGPDTYSWNVGIAP